MMKRRLLNSIFITLFILGLGIRFYLMGFSGYERDIDVVRIWAKTVEEHGIGKFYEFDAFHEYPPGYLYVLKLFKPVYFFLFKSAIPVELTSNYIIFYKSFLLLFDVILAGVGGFIVFKIKRKKKAAMLTSLALFLNPALFYNSAYWGQIDVLLGIGVLVSFYLLYCNFHFWSAFSLGVLALTKLQALVIIPWFFMLCIDRDSKSVLVKMIAGFIFSSLLIFLPFIIEGNLWETLRIVYEAKDVFPYFSLNAFNLWWILGGGEPWLLNSEKVLFNLSAKTAGNLLFLIFYLILTTFYLMKKKKKKFINWILGAAAVENGAFLLLTAMHERYLYLTVAILTFCYFLADKNSRSLRFLTFMLSLTYFLNIVFVMNRVYFRDIIGKCLPFVLSIRFSFVLSYTQIILGAVFFYILFTKYFQTHLT